MKKLKLAGIFCCVLWLGGSLWYWLSQPNNFLYTVESNGEWSFAETTQYRARAYQVRMDAACARGIYADLIRSAAKETAATHDYRRFQQNMHHDIEFSPQEISFPSRFKWLSDKYITYDDPGLKNGIRFSFRNKCLYDKECSLNDSVDYLFVKIGINYLLKAEEKDALRKCVAEKKMYYQIRQNYNFGRSDRHYRNGIFLWLGERLTNLPLALFFFLIIL